MSNETIGYRPPEVAKMPEIRGQNLIEARFAPPLSNKDRRLNMLTDSQLEFFAQVLS